MTAEEDLKWYGLVIIIIYTPEYTTSTYLIFHNLLISSLKGDWVYLFNQSNTGKQVDADGEMNYVNETIELHSDKGVIKFLTSWLPRLAME